MNDDLTIIDRVRFFIREYSNFSSIKYCVTNLWKWKSVICKDRWWDYSFFLELLLFKLKDMEENWGRNTHYIGDYDDKKILQELISDLELLIEMDDDIEYKEEDRKKVANRFFGKLGRHYHKFWD